MSNLPPVTDSSFKEQVLDQEGAVLVDFWAVWCGPCRVLHPVLEEICRSAEVPNIHIKMSGFHYVSQTSWDYPYSDTHWIVRRLYEAYGPDRLCWGSDYPVVRFDMTHRHAVEAFRTHCSFIPQPDKDKILGGTLERLLSGAGA